MLCIDLCFSKTKGKTMHRHILKLTEQYASILPKDFSVKIYDTLPSTNSLLKSSAQTGAPEGTTVIALHQTEGRGRSGRSFFSPNGTGLYLSILLRPDIDPENSLFITTGAAVATAKALESIHSPNIGIKWVNDLFIKDKKVGGILTEASLSTDARRLDYVVLGIGINLAPPTGGFPDEIKNIAGAVFEDSQKVTDELFGTVAAKLIVEFFTVYNSLPSHEFMKEYRHRSILLGRSVTVTSGTDSFDGTVDNIDNEGHLILRLQDGTCRSFSSGEARVRTK